MTPAPLRYMAAAALLLCLALIPASGLGGTEDSSQTPAPHVKLRGRAIPLITIVGSAEGPKFARRVAPDYPFAAKKRGQEGSVVLRLNIDEAGTLKDVEVVEASDPVFINAAIASVKRSLFIAAKNNHRPVASQAILPIHFKLKN